MSTTPTRNGREARPQRPRTPAERAAVKAQNAGGRLAARLTSLANNPSGPRLEAAWKACREIDLLLADVGAALAAEGPAGDCPKERAP